MTKYTQVRLTQEQRRAQILDAACGLAGEGHLMTMSLAQIAAACSCSTSKSTIKYYFKSLSGVRGAVIDKAVEVRMLPIVAIGLVNKEPRALAAPEDIRKAALKLLSE